MPWRLVDSDLQMPAYTSACDEAIMVSRSNGLVPNTLHFYRRASPTISLGYFESIEDSVDCDVVKKNGIQIVRRMSGGSAIYTDPDQLIYSLIVNKEIVPENPNETYSLICRGIIRALGDFGIRAEFKPVNDVLVNKKKISGSAQLRRFDIVVQHGTVIVKCDFDRMFHALKPKQGKIRTKEEMTSLSEELGYIPSFPAVKYALKKGFSDLFGVEIREGQITEKERKDIDILIKEKYGNAAYTLMR